MDILSYIGYAPNYKVQPYIESSIRLGVISPWGFVQKNLFKNKYKEKLLPFAVDLQSDEPDIEENTNIKEDVNSSIQKRLDNLEKRVKLYENIIDISLLTSVEKN
ncbi:31116_t:CDS:2, partial [Gigaspora margarita]